MFTLIELLWGLANFEWKRDLSRNLYQPHTMLKSSGYFWRCEHGTTGFGENKYGDLIWEGCLKCALKNPIGYLRFNKKKWFNKKK